MSSYHLALRINYPNAFDRASAIQQGRTALGGDIMIHGSTGSVGCLAMGDEVSEDLFVLTADTGLKRIKVILSPVDFRTGDLPSSYAPSAWVRDLYGQIRAELAKLPRLSQTRRVGEDSLVAVQSKLRGCQYKGHQLESPP